MSCIIGDSKHGQPACLRSVGCVCIARLIRHRTGRFKPLPVLLLIVAVVMQSSAGADRRLAPGYAELGYALPTPGSYALPVLGVASDGVVLDSEGRASTLHELFDHKFVLLGFIYSRCSDVNGCPLTSYVFYKLKSMMQTRPELAANLKLISLSFDPAFDTPAVMKLYAQNFKYAGGSGEWEFLTTENQAALKPILDAYGQDIKLAADSPDISNTDENISHILRVYLIDPERNIRNIYSVAFLHPDLVVRDFETLVGEPAYRLERADMSSQSDSAIEAAFTEPPLGLPVLPEAALLSMTPASIALGRKLFFDRRLSLNDTFSCGMCHIPEQGFTSNELETAIGIEGRTVRRNSPSLFNVAYMQRLFHDAREDTLEQQIWGPLLNRNEMGNPSIGTVLRKLRSLPDYSGQFEKAFPDRGLDITTLGQALASYERTLVSGNSVFDRWYFRDGRDAPVMEMSPEAKYGFELFTGKARCSSCHLLGEDSALFTDQQLHNTGVGYAASMGRKALDVRPGSNTFEEKPGKMRVQLAPGVFVNVEQHIIDSVGEEPPADVGLYEITQNPVDRWKYLTPGLRNVALTAPYMHDGSLQTLGEVVRFYNQGGVPNEELDPRISPLSLTQAERAALVAFLKSLTGDNVPHLVEQARAAPPGDTMLSHGAVSP